jgi:hypothetical protein
MDILEEPQVVARILTTRLSAEHPVWVMGCPFDYVRSTSGVPQVADDLLHGTKSAGSGQEETLGLPDFLRELLRKFTAMVDEQLR